MTQSNNTTRQDIEFVIRARERASGQFQRVEESTQSMGEKLLWVASTVLPLLTTAVGFLEKRFAFLRTHSVRLGRAVLGLWGPARLLLATLTGLGAAAFIADKAIDLSLNDTVLTFNQSVRSAQLGISLLNDAMTSQELEEATDHIIELFGKDMAQAFFNNEEAVTSLATLMNDPVLRDQLLGIAQEMNTWFGVDVPAAFAALEALHAGDAGPLNQIKGLSEEMVASIGTGPAAIALLQEHMDKIDLEPLEKLAAAWERLKGLFGVDMPPILTNFVAHILTPLLNSISGIAERGVILLKEVFGPLGPILSFLGLLLVRPLTLFTKLFDLLANIIIWGIEVIRFFNDLVQAILGVSDARVRLWERISGSIQNIKSFAKNAAEGVQSLIDKVKGLFDIPGIGRVMGTGGGGLFGPIADMLGFAQGGVVPGPMGAPRAAIVHGGETIIPVGGNQGRPMIIQLMLDRKVIGEVAVDAVSEVATSRSGLRRLSVGGIA